MRDRSVELDRHHKVLWRKWLWLCAIVIVTVVFQATDSFARSHIFLINRSASLPHWAFFIERGALPSRGDIAFFKLPKTDLAVRHFGERPAPFGKIVYGMPGDVIERHGENVSIRMEGDNGASLVKVVGQTKSLTKTGEVLVRGPVGVIPQDCYYMGSPHKDGFDSRYAAVGLVCARQVIGVARRVFL